MTGTGLNSKKKFVTIIIISVDKTGHNTLIIQGKLPVFLAFAVNWVLFLYPCNASYLQEENPRSILSKRSRFRLVTMLITKQCYARHGRYLWENSIMHHALFTAGYCSCFRIVHHFNVNAPTPTGSVNTRERHCCDAPSLGSPFNQSYTPSPLFCHQSVPCFSLT